jgi:hypothetical protein
MERAPHRRGGLCPRYRAAGIPLTPALDVGTRAGYDNRSFSIASNNLRRITPDHEQRERKGMTPAKLRVYFHKIGLISNRALPFHPTHRSAASTRSRVRRSKGCASMLSPTRPLRGAKITTAGELNQALIMCSLSKSVLIIGPANLAFCDSGAGAKESVAKCFWSLKASSNICDQSSANQWSTRSMSSGRHAPY